MYQDLVDDEDDEIVAKPKDKPTLSTIENNDNTGYKFADLSGNPLLD